MTDKITKHATIAAALAAAQAAMGRAAKSADNDAFKRNGKASKYADLASVMDACMPALTLNGIAVTQPVKREDGEIVLYTILHHADSDQTLDDGGLPLIVNKRDMQGLGSALTYARRYGLMAMAGIAADDDDGNAAAAAAPPPTPRQKPAEPPTEAIEAARSSLFNADSLDVLKAIFVGLPASVRSLQAVIDAKDARKAELETAPADNADLGDDFIPH
jgi:hypothetical protein